MYGRLCRDDLPEGLRLGLVRGVLARTSRRAPVESVRDVVATEGVDTVFSQRFLLMSALPSSSDNHVPERVLLDLPVVGRAPFSVSVPHAGPGGAPSRSDPWRNSFSVLNGPLSCRTLRLRSS